MAVKVEQVNRIAEVIKQYLIENGYATLDLSEGTPLYEILVRGLAVSLASFYDELMNTESQLYLSPEYLNQMSQEQLEKLAANFVIPVTAGSKATVIARIYFSPDIKPDSITITKTDAFYTKSGLAFYPVVDQTFTTFEFDATVGYWYIEVLLEAEAEGDDYMIQPGELSSATGFTYTYITNPAPATGGFTGDTIETLITKIQTALTTRELATRDAIAYLLSSNPSWTPDAYFVAGQEDIELQRDVVDNIKTGHTADIYYYKANEETPVVTGTGLINDLPVDSGEFLQGFAYLDVDGSFEVAGQALGAFSIELVSLSGTTLTPVIGSIYGRGTYGRGPFGVGDSPDIYIRNMNVHTYKSTKAHFRIYFNPLLFFGASYNVSFRKFTNITAIQTELDSKSVFVDYLVKGFLHANPIITLTVKQGREEIDVDTLKAALKERIESIAPSQGLDKSAVISVVEDLYPTSYTESINVFKLRQEHPKGYFLTYDFISEAVMQPKIIPEYGVTPRVYRFVVNLDDIEVILK